MIHEGGELKMGGESRDRERGEKVFWALSFSICRYAPALSPLCLPSPCQNSVCSPTQWIVVLPSSPKSPFLYSFGSSEQKLKMCYKKEP